MADEQKSVVYRTVLQCPACGFKVTERMPLLEKVSVFVCPACEHITRISDDACCIFCSYGRIACPQAQRAAQNKS